MGIRTRAGAWNIDFPGVSGKAPAGGFKRCPLNLNSHNHNQHAGRPCFSLAVQIERSTSTLRYDIPGLRNRASSKCVCISCARRLLTAASVNDGRTVVRLLHIECSASDSDDNRTALYASPIARFAELGMSVSLSIFIQLPKYNGRRSTSHLCQQATSTIGSQLARLTILPAQSELDSGSSPSTAAISSSSARRFVRRVNSRSPSTKATKSAGRRRTARVR